MMAGTDPRKTQLFDNHLFSKKKKGGGGGGKREGGSDLVSAVAVKVSSNIK